MKKRYIILPAACVVVLALVIVFSVIIANGRYLKKLPYDHVDRAVYNGVEIVGENGLFYLVKDGKKLTEGYSSLKSVNDLYENIGMHEDKKTDIVLFEYYLARRADSESLFLVSASGEEYTIDGETYSLDLQNTKLPYLVFTNNQNGMRSAISLHRLDSDISYQSGKLLTLRTFKSLTPHTVGKDDILCSYLETSDNSEQEQRSFFGQDGIKITGGEHIQVMNLEDSMSDTRKVFFYNEDDGYIMSVGRELVASNVTELRRGEAGDWKYAVCKEPETEASCIVSFSPHKIITFSQKEYDITTAWDFGNCLVMRSAATDDQNIVNIFSGLSSQYDSVVSNSVLMTAQGKDGSYIYIDRNGAAVTQSKYGDMIPNVELSARDCYVLTSATAGPSRYYFARVGAEIYELELDVSTALSSLDINDTVAYKLTHTQTGATPEENTYTHALLAPFSTVKLSKYYNVFDVKSFGDTSYIWANDGTEAVYDLLDPLTAKPLLSLKTTSGGVGSYELATVGEITLLEDADDDKTAVNIAIVSLYGIHSDKQKSSIRYLALYRPELKNNESRSVSALQINELGYGLNADKPYEKIDNYLVTYTSVGSEIYSLDAAGLSEEGIHIPYHVTGIRTDEESDEKFFLVRTQAEKYGLYNTAGEQILAPYYADISHVENGYYIVSLRGAYGVIHSSGAGGIKNVIDFKYISVIALGDGGYAATAGDGTTTVYFGKRTVVSGAVQSCKYIMCYTVNEDGVLKCDKLPLISMKGNLYTHK